MDLILGAGHLDRRVSDVEGLVREYNEKEKDWGVLYLDYEPVTPKDKLLVEDLAVTMLINSRVSARAATAVCANGAKLNLGLLPNKALEQTTPDERQVVAEVIATMASWPWLGASIATKTLHKKQPALVPVLDNQAIFGAYMNPKWPEQRSLAETIKAVARIREALDWIAVDLTRKENALTWAQLEVMESRRSRIDLFDMVWWINFRRVEPVG
jgi:Family of unknown function (DUF6308)